MAFGFRNCFRRDGGGSANARSVYFRIGDGVLEDYQKRTNLPHRWNCSFLGPRWQLRVVRHPRLRLLLIVRAAYLIVLLRRMPTIWRP